MVELCSADFGTFITGTILPLSLYAALATATIMAIVFMLGRMLSNPRLLVWVETEIVQLAISCFSVALIVLIVNSFCALNFSDIAGVFGQTVPQANLNLYQAAGSYLSESAIYAHNAMNVVRYHLEAYTVLSYFNAFNCDFSVGSVGFGCLFGYGGTNEQPFGGYGAMMAALNIFFNSTVISYFTALNFLMILLFTYRGFAFFFLPLGIFLRSMPYLRSFGSLLIAVSLSFVIVYPLILSVFYLMGNVVVDRGNGYVPVVGGTDLKNFYYGESVFSSQSGEGQSLQAIGGTGRVFDSYFPNGDNPIGAMIFAGFAFVAAAFIPTVALLATIASVAYIAHLYGEEIDLSRLVQLV